MPNKAVGRSGSRSRLVSGWRNLFCSAALLAAFSFNRSSGAEIRADQILVKPKASLAPHALEKFHSAQGVKILQTFTRFGGLQIVRVPEGETASGLISKYQSSGLVEFAEPDYFGHVFNTYPNDPDYINHVLWGLDNISAPAAWDVLTSASNIIVAVVDTGVRYTHQDLAANMWANPADGSHGWNALTGTNNPYDDGGGFSLSHGTLVAGVVGAVGNNGIGVVGVAWRLQLMACQAFDNSTGIGSVSGVLACLEFAQTNHARIINASWGFNTNSLSLSNAIYSLRDNGIIVVAAPGNSGTNIDTNPTYPASYAFDNVISVANTTQTDGLASSSSYSPATVQLGAPGTQIYSTFAASDSFYYYGSGTSFSAPYVAGAFALLMTKFPAETYQQLISRLLNGVDPLPSLAGKCVTGGRLNLHSALSPPINLTALPTAAGQPFELQVSAGPRRLCVVQASADLVNWTAVYTNTTADDGMFDLTDPGSLNSSPRFYRATAAP